MDTNNTNSAQECCICLENANARGGKPLISPGCCGKTFHLDCLSAHTQKGSKTCPACRAELAAMFTQNSTAAAAAPVSAQVSSVGRAPRAPPQQTVTPSAQTTAVNPPHPPPQRSSFFGSILGAFTGSSTTKPPPPTAVAAQPQQGSTTQHIRRTVHQRGSDSSTSDLQEDELDKDKSTTTVVESEHNKTAVESAVLPSHMAEDEIGAGAAAGAMKVTPEKVASESIGNKKGISSSPIIDNPTGIHQSAASLKMNDHNNTGIVARSNEWSADSPAQAFSAAVAAASTAIAAPSSSHPSVVLESSPELPEVRLEGDKSFHVRVSVKYQSPTAKSLEEEEEESKVPLDVICILDNSGSMGGSKIDNLKRAVEFVTSTLDSSDRLCVIKFNSRATGVHGLKKMTEANKVESRSRVRDIHAGGGTDIYGGMEMAQQVLSDRKTTNPSTCVFLLTDGQDGSNFDRKKDLARQWSQQGVSLFVFGFGADHDSAHMNGIADAGEGSFTYIDTDDTVIDAFGGALGAQQGAALRNISVQLRGASAGAVFSHVSAGNYKVATAADGSSSSICFASLYTGETRDILVRMTVPALPAVAATANYPLLTAAGTYSLQTADETVRAGGDAARGLQCTDITCTIARPLDADCTPAHLLVRDTEVDVQVNRHVCVTATREAMNAADRGDFTAATNTLEAAKMTIESSISFSSGNAIVVALVDELKDYLVRVRDRGEYQSRGGRAMMSEGFSTVSNQRSAYTKCGKTAMYQNISSATVQSKAKASKGGW